MVKICPEIINFQFFVQKKIKYYPEEKFTLIFEKVTQKTKIYPVIEYSQLQTPAFLYFWHFSHLWPPSLPYFRFQDESGTPSCSNKECECPCHEQAEYDYCGNQLLDNTYVHKGGGGRFAYSQRDSLIHFDLNFIAKYLMKTWFSFASLVTPRYHARQTFLHLSLTIW